MVVKPPFQVPPEVLDHWDERFEEDFKKWKAKGNSKSATKLEYRQQIININSEWNMEEVFNQIEVGLAAIDKLIAYRKRYPTYNMNLDLDEMYDSKDIVIYKDFIKYGVKLVEHYEKKSSESEPVKNMEKQEIKKEMVDKIKNEPADELSQLETNNKTPIETLESLNTEKKAERRKNKGRKKRQERLLKFQTKLVISSGLPPSRLMRKRLDQGSPPGQFNVKKNLVQEFEQLAQPSVSQHGDGGQLTPPVLMPGQPAAPVQMPGQQTYVLMPEQPASLPPPPHVQMPALTSPTVLMPGQPVSTSPPVLMPGQPAAPIPWQTAPTHLDQLVSQIVASSGIKHFPTLCCSPVTFVGDMSTPAPGGMSKADPFPNSRNPAYCFHCLQFGNVFTINQV